jgi:ABC-type proline/glycine betaine transport system ATPase subunit
MVQKRKKLPDVLIALKNKDKEFHEQWTAGRNMLDIPHPFRGVLLGPPNCGKSTTVKNILLRADPPFESVTVIHCDPEHTKEYQDLGDSCEIRGDIPTIFF